MEQTHLDDGHHISCRLLPLAEVDVEVGQLIPFCIDDDIPGPLPHGIYTAEVGSWIQNGIRGSRQDNICH